MDNIVQLTSRDGKVFIDDKPVIRGLESFSGWYWFAIEKAWEADKYH